MFPHYIRRSICTFLPKLAFCFSIIKISKFFKISFILGSTCTFFSGTAIVSPLIGLFAGGPATLGIFLLDLLLRYLLFGMFSFHMLAYYLPGFCAAIYFAYPTIVVRLILPVFCIFLFILHPVGGQAFVYSFYWLIPIVIYFLRPKSIFLHAAASTFIAHAVGSVIWMYTVPMSAVVWYSLMPLVFVERVAFACGIVISYKVINFIHLRLNSLLFFDRDSCIATKLSLWSNSSS